MSGGSTTWLNAAHLERTTWYKVTPKWENPHRSIAASQHRSIAASQHRSIAASQHLSSCRRCCWRISLQLSNSWDPPAPPAAGSSAEVSTAHVWALDSSREGNLKTFFGESSAAQRNTVGLATGSHVLLIIQTGDVVITSLFLLQRLCRIVVSYENISILRVLFTLKIIPLEAG